MPTKLRTRKQTAQEVTTIMHSMETELHDRLETGNSGSRSRRTIRVAIVGFVLALLLLTLFSNTLLTYSLPQVTVSTPVPGALTHIVSGTGAFEPAHTLDLYVETNWPAETVNVKLGDKVEAGQVLVTFNSSDASDELLDERARYRLEEIARDKLLDSFGEAQRNGDGMLARGISRDIESAKLEQQIEQRRIAKLERQLAAFSRLTSTVGGIVTELNAVKGAPVQSGKAAVRVADLSQGQRFTAYLDPEKAKYVNVGDETEIVVVSLGNARIRAKIESIRDPIPGQNAGAAGGASEPTAAGHKEIVFMVRDERLIGGETGEFTVFKRMAPSRQLIPNAAVREDNQGKYALLLKSKRGPLGNEFFLQKAPIATGDADDSMTVVESGLSPQDKVIVSENKPVADGDRVMIAD